MMRILVPVLAILLALGGYLLFGRSEDRVASEEASAAPVAGRDEATQAQPGAPKTAETPVPPAPIRMRSKQSQTGNLVQPVATELSLAQGFAAEELDAEASAAHGELIRGVVEELAESGVGTGHIDELECRSQHCKLRLASGDTEGLVKLVDALQDERGFLGKAESLMLSREEDDIVFYLRFPRPK